MAAIRYSIVEKVLDLPLQNPSFPGYYVGAYKTCQGTWVAEHAVIYSDSLETLRDSHAPLVRINSACFTGDIFGDQRCDCNEQMFHALDLMRTEPGLLIYHFHHEGRGIGFTSKLQTYKDMLATGASTFSASQALYNRNDLRTYGSALLILADLGIKRLRLLTNNPNKAFVLSENGVEVTEVIGTVSKRPELRRYLQSKREEQGHFIDFDVKNTDGLLQ